MSRYVQTVMPGMEVPLKARPLWQLYLDAATAYWGPIAESLTDTGGIGPDGITESDLAGIPEFMDLDTFRVECDRKGVPYK